jgi:hypothetical protein
LAAALPAAQPLDEGRDPRAGLDPASGQFSVGDEANVAATQAFDPYFSTHGVQR